MQIIHILVGLFSFWLAINTLTLHANPFWLSLIMTGLVVYGFTCIKWSIIQLIKPELKYAPDILRMRMGLFITVIGIVGVWYVN